MTWQYPYFPATWPMLTSAVLLNTLAFCGWPRCCAPKPFLSTSMISSAWHVPLENPHTSYRLAFSGVEGLFAFLAEQINPLAGARGVPETPVCTGTEEERGIL